MFSLPWLLALAAAVLAGAFLLWRRRQAATDRHAYAGVSDLVAPDVHPAAPQPLSRTPPPAPERRPTPAAPTRAAAPAPVPAPRAPAPVQPAPTRPVGINGGIVATGLRPKLEFELHPLRAETDERRGAALLLDVIIVNNGHAPARDVLIEAQMINAGPRQDELIGRFFSEPAGKGERLPVIAPMSRVSLKIRLAIPGEQMQPIEIEDRQLFVPLVAFNSLYRWNGGEVQESASFLVGRGDEQDGKMAPFRLDQGAKSWTGLGARPHSRGLQR